MTHILHKSTLEKTASLAYEGNSAYCQSSSAHNIKHNLWKLALRGHLSYFKFCDIVHTSGGISIPTLSACGGAN